MFNNSCISVRVGKKTKSKTTRLDQSYGAASLGHNVYIIYTHLLTHTHTHACVLYGLRYNNFVVVAY